MPVLFTVDGIDYRSTLFVAFVRVGVLADVM